METNLFFTGFKSVLLICAAICFSACTPLPRTTMHVNVQSSPQLNLDAASTTSLPVRLKIYQLNDATRFNDATFRQLWKSDVQILDATLLNKKELTIAPDEVKTIKITRHHQAEYIAVVGIFRHHTEEGWKRV